MVPHTWAQAQESEKWITEQKQGQNCYHFAISAEIPGFSNKINKKKAEVESQLSRAVSMLAERDKSNAIFAQRQSLGGVNELSTMVASLLDQLRNQQQSGSGGGMSMQQFMG